MTLIGLEILIIKGIAVALSHAGPTAATHAAMHATTATAAAASSAGTAGGAAGVVAASGHAAYRIAKEKERYESED